MFSSFDYTGSGYADPEEALLLRVRIKVKVKLNKVKIKIKVRVKARVGARSRFRVIGRIRISWAQRSAHRTAPRTS